MAEVVHLPSRLGETICRIWRLAEQIRVLEAEIEAARRHAAAEFAAENGWFLAPPPGFSLEQLAGRTLGSIGAPIDPGPGCRVDCFSLTNPGPGREPRPAAVAFHTLDPGGREARRFLDRARLLGLWVHPLPDDSWFWPGESVAHLVTPSP